MDEYAKGFSKAVDNLRALIEGRIKACPESERRRAFEDILREDIPFLEGNAHALTTGAYNRRVVNLVENIMGLSRR